MRKKEIQFVYKLAYGADLIVDQSTKEYLLAHPEVNQELLKIAASRLNPPDKQGVTMVELEDTYGNWGKSGLVEVDEDHNFFAFRKGRKTPTSVIDHEGIPASKLAMITKPLDDKNYTLITAFCSDGQPATLEPITPMVDTTTEKGQQLRKEFLDFWKTHAPALGITPIDGEPFQSTWEEVIEKYGNEYNS